MGRVAQFLLLGTVVVLLPTAAYSQAQGSITGVVRDTSGAVLPGVTVEASSPVLIEKTRSVVTDGTGQYRFINLFPGTYSVTFTLPGFNTVKRDGLEVTGAFVATVNVELRVGALEETITVTGDTPVVDVQSTTKQRVLSREVMDSVPTSRVPYELAVLVPGVTARNGGGTAAVQDVGGTAGNQQANSLVVHGSKPVDMRLTYNGLTLATLETGKNAGAVNNSTALQEITVDSAAVSAELSTGGVRINLVPREGGNTFKGTWFSSFTNSSMQGSNYSDELKNRGLTTPDRVKKLWDVNPGVGGPIKKDRLWFYTAVRYNGWQNWAANAFYNVNEGNANAWTYVADQNRPVASDNVWKDAQVRLTWQATPRNRFAGTWNHQYGATWAGGSATSSPESVARNPFDPKRNIFGDWTFPATNKLLIEAVGVNMFERQTPKPLTTPLIAVTEQNGGRTYRGLTTLTVNFLNTNYYYRGSLSYVTGAHNFKVGFNNGGGRRIYRAFNLPTVPLPVSYRFNNGVPNQITIRATPYSTTSNLDADGGIYAQDKWTIDRLTLSLGVRYDFYSSSFDEAQLGPAPLAPTRNFVVPAQDGVKLWKDITPKMGVSYDLFGNGKTALKATLNKYVQGQALGGDLPDRPFGFPLNSVYRLVSQTTRSWSDANRDFVPDCDLTNPVANGECGAMANSNFGKPGADTTYDPSILDGWGKRAGYNWEFSTAVQHEIVPRVSLDVGYFRRWYGNLLLTDNLATAPSDFDPYSITAPTNPGLPNGGGYTISGLYDLNPAKFGVPVNNLRTFSDAYGKQIEHWNGYDASINARLQNGLLLQGGISSGRTVTDNCDVVTKVDNPSTLYCHIETPFLSQYKALAAYTVPRIDVQVSGTFQSVPGPDVTANLVVPTATAAQTLGRPLSGGAANVTVNLIAPGTVQGDRHNQLDLRAAKLLRFGNTRTTLNFDLYNALNAAPVLSENPNYSAFRQPTSILPARFLKIGLQFDF